MIITRSLMFLPLITFLNSSKTVLEASWSLYEACFMLATRTFRDFAKAAVLQNNLVLGGITCQQNAFTDPNNRKKLLRSNVLQKHT